MGSRSRLQLSTSAALVDVPCEVRLVLSDRYANELTAGGQRVEAKAYGSKASDCTVVDHENGTYTITFVAAVAGEYKVQVRVENNELAPLAVKVVDGKD